MNKKKFFKIFFPLLGVAVLLTGVYWSLIEFVLKDYRNLGVIQFRYISEEGNAQSPAYITGIKATDKTDYPDEFEVPSKLLGHPVVGIDSKAFTNLSHLKKVILPKTVEEIGDEAFSECPLLTDVVVKGELKSIGSDIFKNSGWLNAHTDKEFITFEKFLYKYNGTHTVDFTLKSAKDKKAGENENEYVYIPEDIKKLCSGSFAGVSHLKKVEMPSDFTTIEKNLFKDCKDLVEVSVNNVTSIDAEAFNGCINLTTIDLSNIKTIGSSAFSATALESVALNNELTSINASVFENCDSLTSIAIPNNLESVGNYAFAGTTALTSISLPNSVNAIGNGAFMGSGIQAFAFPELVDTISDDLFLDATSLSSVTLPSVTYRSTEDEYSGIVSIGARSFKNTTSLQSVTFPTLEEDGQVIETIRTIGASAFEGSALTTVKIPSLVRTLYEATFKNCQSLTSVEFADKGALESINAECFMGTTALTSITFPNTVREFFNAVLMNSGVEEVVLPNNASFTTLTRSFFEGCSNLHTVVLPDSITTIYQNAFKDCTSLTSLTIGTGVKTVQKDVFSGVSSTFTLNIAGGESQTARWQAGWDNGLEENQIVYLEQ